MCEQLRLAIWVLPSKRGSGLDPHRMQPILRLPPLNNLRETSRLPVHRLCHFLPSPSLTLSTKETFQINVFSSLKTFSQTFRPGKGNVSSGNGQAHAGTEWCEKEKKSYPFHQVGRQCVVSLTLVLLRGPRDFLEGKTKSMNENYWLLFVLQRNRGA